MSAIGKHIFDQQEAEDEQSHVVQPRWVTATLRQDLKERAEIERKCAERQINRVMQQKEHLPF